MPQTFLADDDFVSYDSIGAGTEKLAI